MIESKYLKENIENIQRLMSISALKHFETRNLGKAASPQQNPPVRRR